MGIDYSVPHAACLVSQLPRESRVMRSINPAFEWGTCEYMLAEVLDRLAIISWQWSSDDSIPKPTPMRRPGQPVKQNQGMTVSEYEEVLNKPRRER
jgi:hypothetical protein